jgi:regulator of protease activity HflC (stomatin/prohibitin superfamily)
MTRNAAAALLATVIVVAIYETRPTPELETRIEVQTIVREVITTIDLDELIEHAARLDEELTEECVAIIQRWTDEPKAGILHHVERHYEGDVCAYADEVVRANW